ncbi:hypothetical protein CCACVL1_11322 [Corchorus capsularis]|uniref:Uncharacterized protein n=1 Tax=Corchorus capsularis TaxID=210143 RepID=A0A1R3IM18_COCAP|nr:hypothetical protein CCACVL1_11322 [Corchorus capsularis]
MGISLSCFRQPSPQKHDRSSCSSMLGCLWGKETKKRQLEQKEMPQLQQQLKKAKEVTLEEWLIASPGLQKHNNSGSGEYHVFKHSSKRVFPSFIGENHGNSSKINSCSNPRGSFSKESLLKFEDNVEREEVEISISRSQSGKSKKKVSFRLPEEADIFIFHSSSSSEEYSAGKEII